MAGLVPQVTCGTSAAGVDRDVAVEGRRRRRSGASSSRRPRPRTRAARRKRSIAPRDVLDRHVVGRDQPGPGAGLDRHVADRHPPFHRQGRDRRAVVFDHMTGRPPGADLPDDRQDDVLGLEARRQLAGDLDAAASGAEPLPERLRGQHVLDLAGADPEGQGAERAVSARVAVAADDRQAGQRQPQLGPDHVHDPLMAALDVVERDAELAAIRPQRLDLPARQAGRGCRAGSPSARCDRPSRTSGPAGEPGDRPAGAHRTPGGWSPHAPGAGRCRGASPPPSPVTTWRFQTFSNNVSGMFPIDLEGAHLAGWFQFQGPQSNGIESIPFPWHFRRSDTPLRKKFAPHRSDPKNLLNSIRIGLLN